MKKTAHTLPVSRKFIARIEQRIADVLTAIGSYTPEVLAQAMSYVHTYLEQRTLPSPADDISRQCHLILLTLRAEIDAAIVRSERARQRRRLKEATSAGQSAPAEVEVQTTPAEAVEQTTPAEYVTQSASVEVAEPSSPTGIIAKPAKNIRKEAKHGQMFHPYRYPDRTPKSTPAPRGRFGLKIVHVGHKHGRRRQPRL